MRERGGIDERGFWCVPLDGMSWIYLPKLLKSTLQWDSCSVLPTQLCTHSTHLLPLTSSKTHIHMQTQHWTITVIVLHDNEKHTPLTNFQMFTPDFTSLYFHFFTTPYPRDWFFFLGGVSSHISDFSLFPNTLERKVFSLCAEKVWALILYCGQVEMILY